MTLKDIIDRATDKSNFCNLAGYMDFCSIYLEYIKTELQAVIVSRKESHYNFFQYNSDGTYNVSRPINTKLMLSLEDFILSREKFINILKNIREQEAKQRENRKLLNDFVYSCQQSIGAALDALPANRANTARKLNGDLFEQLIRLIIQEMGINVTSGTISLPIKQDDTTLFHMHYQHDLIIKVDDVAKAIGSVKTSSKDRIDKIFIDKFIYNKLTNTKTPHFAIFLNDVQRSGKEGKYSISTTFSPGHFKGYTIKLNPLDGVYYIDIRPDMTSSDILKNHIKTFDNFLLADVWKFVLKG